MNTTTTPDWLDRLHAWMDRNPGRLSALFLLAAALVIGGVKFVQLVARDGQEAQHAAEAIQKHVTWLRDLPVEQKRTWPVRSYCHPASAPHGECSCYEYHDPPEVSWPERLENGDGACHAQR